MRFRAFSILVLGVLCAVMVAQTSSMRRATSITFDETFYLSCALHTISSGRLDPRLAAHGAAPLAVLATYVPPLLHTGGERRPTPWMGLPHDAQLITGPRFWNSLLFGVSLVVVVFVWLYRRHGLPAAALGAGLLALSPSIVAHSSLATLDAALTFFSTVALLVLTSYLRQPSRLGLVTLAVAIGAAMSAKYSGVYLLGVAGLAFVMIRAGGDRITPPRPDADARSFSRHLRRAATSWLRLAVLACVAWWGFHLFAFSGPLKTLPVDQTPDSSPWVRVFGRGPIGQWVMQTAHERIQMPAPVAGLDFQQESSRRGYSAYFMGETSRSGWRLYYPAAFVFKSTPAELALTLCLIAAAAWSVPRLRTNWRRLDPAVQVLIIGVLIYALLMLTTRINAGHRYLLPLYPLLALLGADRMAAWLPGRHTVQLGVAAALLGVQAVSSGGIAPHYLAYFNRLSGGPEQGWRLLSDSNIDWGQDLPALRDLLAARGNERAALGYFGTADPAAYDIVADPLDALDRDLGTYKWLAVSVTVLHGQKSQGIDPFREMRSIPPHARAGYSIFVYDLRNAAAREAFETAVARLRSSDGRAARR